MKKRKQQSIDLDLPEDIMIDILRRLPFDSVKALKCVSKQWKSVIDDPKFFNSYGDKAVTFLCKQGLYSLSLRSRTNELNRRHPPFTVRRIPIDPRNRTMVCNGMACSYPFKGEFLFYDLFTGASHNVTGPPLQEFLSSSWQCLGLGYDAKEDDYKMMVVCRYQQQSQLWPEDFDIESVQNKENDSFWVCSFKSLVWKRLEGFPYSKYNWSYIWYLRMPCSLNGVIHWGVSSKERPFKSVVVTYDMRSCRFGEMAVPGGAYELSRGSVMELGGELCYWVNGDNGKIEVWVMKEYGVEESWTRLLSVDTWRLSMSPSNKGIEPVTQCEGGDGRRFVLFVCPCYGSLYWCDVENDEVYIIQKRRWQRTRLVRGSNRK